eukprot:TRINITY_DN1075_c0_g1_i2.p1 TRINITY_DN1075_c0_g1~~TRINITY_DN1075_c0_g1_i2.p1  ORF type:complete len:311 (+),score=49.03 TRINITY_DN1075_c0_g1_i2:109-1041(+)
MSRSMSLDSCPRKHKKKHAPPKDNELKEFHLTNDLVGSGAYSHIWRAVSKGDPSLPLVAKVSSKTARRTRKNYLAALSVLQTLKHPNLIVLHHHQETTGWFYLFLEYHPRPTQTLTQTLQSHPLTDPLVLKIALQVSCVLAYMHQHGWGHRDIKPCNILFNPQTEHVTVLDLGFAAPTEELCEDFTGSPLYAAPEVLAFERYSVPKSDSWSLGIVLYQLLHFGSYPFMGDTLEGLTESVLHDPLEFPKEDTCSELKIQLQSITAKLLCKSPNERAYAVQVKEMLTSLSNQQQQLDFEENNPYNFYIKSSQ